MADNVIQVVDANGQASGSTPYLFAQHAEMGSEALTIVSILGAQASGKSTLFNEMFGTSFSVASRTSIGAATTKGIYASLDQHSSARLVAMDVEGSDSRERGRNGRLFHSRLASFVTAISDAIIVNIWYHDLGRWDGAGYTLIGDIFAEALKLSSSSSSFPFHSRLIFTIRDVELDLTAGTDTSSLQSVLFADVEELFAKVKASVDSSEQRGLSDLFSLSCVSLPHMKHHHDQFNQAVNQLAKSLYSPTDDGALLTTEDSKCIPADACGSFITSLWESQYAMKSTDPSATMRGDAPTNGVAGEDASTGSSLMAAYKCNEVFSEVLSKASASMKALSSNSLDAGEKIDQLGIKAEQIMTDAMNGYDEKTEAYKEEAIQLRKRRELESIIDTQQQAMFMKQVQVLRENALTHFKSAANSDDMPSDLAFYMADSQFLKEAEEAKRPGCSWNITQERTDLQNMMQEISTQRKRLLTSQVTAAQHQAHALQYLQMQQSQMNAIQAQAYGGGGGAGQWNVGAAYRPPDTNINASLSYQQGRTNIQISMVPDESASLLGPNGFTSGVGPGNLGLSFNIGL